jgi:hypothetical protein
MARPRGKLSYLASKIRNVEESKNGSKVVWGRGCKYSPRGGLLEAISFVDACMCCHLVVAPSNRFIVVLVVCAWQ